MEMYTQQLSIAILNATGFQEESKAKQQFLVIKLIREKTARCIINSTIIVSCLVCP